MSCCKWSKIWLGSGFVGCPPGHRSWSLVILSIHKWHLIRYWVIKLLKGLNPSKALEPDELHPRVLKELATELGPVFAHLFQQSIDTGEIPKEWSLANICPFFKKSDRSLACNYRPVSLTCVLCKLLEHIVCSNIMAHLDEYKLLSDRQHAFRKRHSCETQLTTVINDWAKILDNRGQVDTFILDFEKAFDTPPHELIKSKLFSYGIGGKTSGKFALACRFCLCMSFIFPANLPSYLRCNPGNWRDWPASFRWDMFIRWVLNKRS